MVLPPFRTPETRALPVAVVVYAPSAADPHSVAMSTLKVPWAVDPFARQRVYVPVTGIERVTLLGFLADRLGICDAGSPTLLTHGLAVRNVTVPARCPSGVIFEVMEPPWMCDASAAAGARRAAKRSANRRPGRRRGRVISLVVGTPRLQAELLQSCIPVPHGGSWSRRRKAIGDTTLMWFRDPTLRELAIDRWGCARRATSPHPQGRMGASTRRAA